MLFSVQVRGSGVETISGRTFNGGVPADYFAQSFVAAFESPAATPEPTTGVLLAAAFAGGYCARAESGRVVEELVPARGFDAIDDDDLHRSALGLQLQAKLLLHGGEK
jgi:hypothetical protein